MLVADVLKILEQVRQPLIKLQAGAQFLELQVRQVLQGPAG
jgi:hypothetical protein